MKYLFIQSATILLFACSNAPKITTNNDLEIVHDSIQESYASADSSKNLLIDLNYLLFKSNNQQLTDSLNSFVVQQFGNDSATHFTNPSQYIKDYANTFKSDFMQLAQDSFMPYVSYENQLQIAVMYNLPERIGLAANNYLFTAGAHGINSTIYANFNKVNGKKLTVAACFKNPETIRKKAEEIFRKELEIPANASLNEAGFWFENDKFKLTENFLLKDSSVEFFYNVYEIAPYSNGPTIIEVPVLKHELLSKD